MIGDVLIVFVKAPRPSAVKTRLAAFVGDEAAVRLYRLLAEEEVRRTAAHAGEYERLFFFAPAEARAEVEAWLPGETLLPQEGADLGVRMAAAFAEAFRRGARRVAIVGSDVPWVTRERVLEALVALDDHDVVLGPAADGGYYLMALAQPQASLFTGIAWSTAAVLAATVDRASVLGLAVRLLDVLPDVDTIADVRAAWPRLEPLLRNDPDLATALSRAAFSESSPR